jgi:uncharacterized protein YkwD
MIRNVGLARIALVLGFPLLGGFLAAAVQAQSIAVDPTRAVRQIMGATIAYRESKGVASLTVNPQLMQAAQLYADYQARTNTTGHTADGRSVRDRIVATGYPPCFYAENVYEYWSSPNVSNVVDVGVAAMNFWKNSPGHEQNLRDPRAKHIGVGMAGWTHGTRHYFKVVQVFADDCKPAPSTTPTPIPAPSSDVLKPGGSAAAAAIRARMAACQSGFVWRVARPSDLVCVTPDSRARVASENLTAATRIQPGGGAYGPNTCRSGYVWREAFAGDLTCVTPAVRSQVRWENATAAVRVLGL